MSSTAGASGLDTLAMAARKPPRWKDCPDIYPPTDDIIKALQDPGKIVACRTKEGKEKGMKLTKYDLIQKVAASIFRKIKDVYGLAAGLTEKVT